MRAYKPHPVLALAPHLTAEEMAAAVERISRYRQHDAIEALDGKVVVGWSEFLAARKAGLEPNVVTISAPPGSIAEYVLRRNIPRAMSGLQRGCWAVLAFEKPCKTAGRARMAEGGRARALVKVGQKDPDLSEPWGARWFEHAAKIVGVSPGCVRTLARIHRRAPDVFQAVRETRVRSLSDAKALVEELKDPDTGGLDRALALQRYEEGTSTTRKKASSLRRVCRQIAREKNVARLPPPIPNGQRHALYLGRMEDTAWKIPDASVDLVVADVVYGERAPDMARTVAAISKKKLRPGGVLAIISGHVAAASVMAECVGEGMHWLCFGTISYAGVSAEGLGGPNLADHVDCEPILFFCPSPEPARRINHLHFSSRKPDKRFGSQQKALDAIMDLVASAAGTGAVVYDPCFGYATTAEAALRTGNLFVGSEADRRRFKIGARRMADVERELRSADVSEAAAE